MKKWKEIDRDLGCSHWHLRMMLRNHLQWLMLKMLLVRDEGIEIRKVIRNLTIMVFQHGKDLD